MDRNLPSSDIREFLFETDVSDNPDIDSESDFSLEDFSGGSGDEYVPDLESESSSSEDESVDQPQQNVRPRPTPQSSTSYGPWIQVFPPEPESNIADQFAVRHPGIRQCPPRNSLPVSYFYLFFSNVVWNMMVKETNLHAHRETHRKRVSGEMKAFSRLQKWVDVTVVELKKYMALVINMGLVYKNNITKYWKSSKSQATPFFPSVMTLYRFQMISSMFHLSSSPRVDRNAPGYDPWCKVRKFLDEMNHAFKRYFIPEQNISIDESLIGMKNRCTFIQYMPNKKHKRFGIKKFQTCDSKTSYVLNVALYSGKDFLAEGEGPFTEKVVLDQVTQCFLLDKGYHIYTDNFYTKIPLAHKLADRKTFITGTINKRSKGLSKNVLTKVLGVEESLYYRQNQVLLVGYKQKASRKPVYLITTGLQARDALVRSKSGLQAMKPVLIHNYNESMGGVDASDKSIYHVTCSRTTRKYWKRIFTNLTDMALHNAYILYKLNTDKPMSRSDFLENIVEALVEDETLVNIPHTIQEPVGHALEHLPGRKERLCVICADDPNVKRKRSYYWCPGCNCGVHQKCYHKLQHYWRNISKGRKRALPDDFDSSD